MNQSTPALLISHRDTRGQACVKSLMGIKRRTGVSMPKHLLLKMAFDAGYEAGAEDAGSGELLVETLDLRYALYDLEDEAGHRAGRAGDGRERGDAGARGEMWVRALPGAGGGRWMKAAAPATGSRVPRGSAARRRSCRRQRCSQPRTCPRATVAGAFRGHLAS